MEPGEWHIIYMYLDGESDRLVGTTKWQPHLQEENIDLEIGEEVDILIAERTDLGMKVIIEDLYLGLIYQNEIFHNIQKGDRFTAYIKNIREDGKIDVSLQKQGYKNVVDDMSSKILVAINNAGGHLKLTDKSPPGEIYTKLEMSKKNFKKAIGGLYRQKLIRIEKDGIYLV